MQKQVLEKLKKAAGSKITKHFEEDDMGDEGFVFENGISIQIAPYMSKKYRLSFWNEEKGEGTPIGEHKSIKNLIADIKEFNMNYLTGY